jgi:site-specific DNA recombinase
MDRALFDAVQQKLTDQWTTRSTARSASDHLLTGLLFDDAGHRMVPTHATKAGVRYRYCVSLPHLHGESKITPVGSVSRVAAIEIEDVIVKSQEHLIVHKEKPFSIVRQDRKVVQDWVVRIDVHEDHLALRLKSVEDKEVSGATDDHQRSIPWQKPPTRRSRQMLLPHGVPRSEVRPTRIERRARLVIAISRGRRWLDEIVSGSVTDVQQIATRRKCSVRQVNMTISLAFLAPDLVRAAVEGRVPRGIGVERLRDAPVEWGQQFEALGLNPNNPGRV